MDSQQMETASRNIQRGGRFFALVCRIWKAILIGLMILHVVALPGVLLNQENALFILKFYEGSIISNLMKAVWRIGELSPGIQAAAAVAVDLLSCVVLLLYVNALTQMVDHLAAGGKPFEVSAARKIRRYTYPLLILSLFSLSLGILVSSVSLLFSYLMEYGGYLQEQADQTNRIQEEMIVSFAEITENKSGQTGQHIRRVSEYARILAAQLGYNPEQCDLIRIASTMHDIGKLLIPLDILEKPGRLTNDEYAVIKQHAAYGGQLLENVEGDEMKLSRTIALQHHERYDGAGYPDGLSGGNISMEGRIVAVADVYDALTSRRSYKDPWDEERAYQEIVKGRGTQFDPQVVDAFTAAYDRIQEVRRKFADEAYSPLPQAV